MPDTYCRDIDPAMARAEAATIAGAAATEAIGAYARHICECWPCGYRSRPACPVGVLLAVAARRAVAAEAATVAAGR